MPISPSQIRRLELLGAQTWPAEFTDTLHGWQLCIDQGVTRRANSVLPNAWDGVGPLHEAVEAVERRYRSHGIRPCFKITDASVPANLDRFLDRRGYRSEGHSMVLTAATATIAAPPPAIVVDLLPEPTADWLQTCWPGPADSHETQARRGIVGRLARSRAFALASRSGQPAGAALAVLEQDWVCLTAVHTLPAFRRRGVGLALVLALAGWARDGCAESAFLQVEAENTAAQGLYQTVGFRTAYRYRYRALPHAAHHGIAGRY